MKRPTIPEVRLSKETVKRWYLSAKYRNKTVAMEETRKIYEMLEYLEKHGGIDYFN